jgi:cytochrome c-type biogenesis protein CcmH
VSDRLPRGQLSRRAFLGGLAAVAVSGQASGSQVPQVQDSLAGRGARGTLRDPTAVGRTRGPTLPGENNAEVQAIEKRLACNCGCTLDVFTCRTTDFSCTYSPALHREVLALRASGKTAQEILDAFVSKYGEKALMAPEARGFNLAGYLLPGAAIISAGAGLLFFIARRKVRVAREPVRPFVPAGGEASAQDMERLRHALSELED